MKKSLIYVLSAISFLALNISCAKQEIEPAGDEASNAEEQIITASVNIATKVAYSEVNETNKNAGLKSVWEKGDYFYAIQDDSKVVQFTITSDNYAGKTYAVFSTKTSGVTESTTWKAVLGEGASAKGTTISCEYMGQNGMLDGLGRFNYVVAESTGTEPSFDFENGESLSHILRIKLPAGVKCIEYVPCARKDVKPSGVSNVYDKNDDTLYEALKTSTITLDATSSSGDVVYIAVPTVNNSTKADSYASGEQYGNLKTGVIITILNNDSDNATGSNGYVVDEDFRDKGGIISTVDMTAMTLMKRPKPSEAITVSRGAGSLSWGSNLLKQAVNEVRTGWAPYNIGATAEYEVGNYYSFGELEPRSSYTFVNYSLRSGTPKSSSTNHHYCISSKYTKGSTTSFCTIACSRYDVARVKWGSAWRMPYTIEGYALHNYTYTSGASSYVENATVGGKSGIKILQVSGGNGYIFFSDSGYYDGETLKDASVTYFRMADQRNRSYGNAGYDQSYIYKSPYDGSTFIDGTGKDRAAFGTPVRPVLSSSTVTFK